MTVPKTVLQELVSYYSRTPENPDGINMDDPFELPARIREIRVGTGTRHDRAMSGCRAPLATEPAMIPLETPLQYLKGVGPRRAADLQRVGLATVEDLLYRFPIRYEDRGRFQTDASLRPGRVGVGRRRGASAAASGRRAVRASRSSRCSCATQTGSLRAVWFNQPFLNDVFHPHQRVILFGKLELALARPADAEPAVRDPRDARADGDERGRRADDETLHTGRIVPVYEKTGTLTTKMQRALVHHALAQLPADAAGSAARRRARAPAAVDRRTALHDVHFPPDGTPIEALNALPLAGAAAADLRGVLPVPARPGAAAAPRRSGAQAAVGRRSTDASASRRGGCCRSG